MYTILPDERANITMQCRLYDCGDAGEIKWSVHPDFDYQFKVPCLARSCINFTLDNPSNYNVTCSYGASNATTKFQIRRECVSCGIVDIASCMILFNPYIVEPYFNNNDPLDIKLSLGQRDAVIPFQAVLGVPNLGFSFLKDNEDLNMSDITSDEEGDLHIDEVKPHHGGTYTFKFKDYRKSRSVNVTVVDDFETPAVAVGAEVDILPPLDGLGTCEKWERENVTCEKWERDGVVIESNSNYNTSGTGLQIRQVSSDDVGKVFTCVAAGGRVRLQTTLLSRETLSVCVKGENNRHQRERVLKVCMSSQTTLYYTSHTMYTLILALHSSHSCIYFVCILQLWMGVPLGLSIAQSLITVPWRARGIPYQ